MIIQGLQILEKQVRSKIEDELDKIGLHYRIFTRIKDTKSIYEKIDRKQLEGKPYGVNPEDKKMQDLIGIRVVTYFHDDIYLVKEILEKKFTLINQEIDDLELTVFKPKRTNITFAFTLDQIKVFNEAKAASQDSVLKFIDHTFELQLRTILSEGWHEVDHSLRYKCKSDWESHPQKERFLNGIYASLETNDLALKNLFDELAYQHYKSKNWEALFRTKFRLKFQLVPIRKELVAILDEDEELSKKILKLDRSSILKKLSEATFSLPINVTNLLYLINVFELDNENINKIIPDSVKEAFQI